MRTVTVQQQLNTLIQFRVHQPSALVWPEKSQQETPTHRVSQLTNGFRLSCFTVSSLWLVNIYSEKSRIMVLTWIQHISAGKRGVPCVLNILCEVQHCNFIRAVPNAIWNSNASTKVLHHKMSLAPGLTSLLCVALSLLSSFFSGSRKVLQTSMGYLVCSSRCLVNKPLFHNGNLWRKRFWGGWNFFSAILQAYCLWKHLDWKNTCLQWPSARHVEIRKWCISNVVDGKKKQTSLSSNV